MQQDLHLISAQAEDFEGGGTDRNIIPSSIPASHPPSFTHSCADYGVARQSWRLLCHTSAHGLNCQEDSSETGPAAQGELEPMACPLPGTRPN